MSNVTSVHERGILNCMLDNAEHTPTPPDGIIPGDFFSGGFKTFSLTSTRA